jgi:hypothetical protein
MLNHTKFQSRIYCRSSCQDIDWMLFNTIMNTQCVILNWLKTELRQDCYWSSEWIFWQMTISQEHGTPSEFVFASIIIQSVLFRSDTRSSDNEQIKSIIPRMEHRLAIQIFEIVCIDRKLWIWTHGRVEKCFWCCELGGEMKFSHWEAELDRTGLINRHFNWWIDALREMTDNSFEWSLKSSEIGRLRRWEPVHTEDENHSIHCQTSTQGEYGLEYLQFIQGMMEKTTNSS